MQFANCAAQIWVVLWDCEYAQSIKVAIFHNMISGGC